MRFQKYNSLGEMTTVTVEFALTILASLAGDVVIAPYERYFFNLIIKMKI